VQSEIQKSGCKAPNYLEYHKIRLGLSFKRDAFLAQKPERSDVVVVQAAGNDGMLLDTPDSGTCQDKASKRIVVGALNHENNLAKFSSYGPCVTVNMIGESVLRPAPAGFYTVSNGTSFSAPLLARWLSMRPKSVESAAALQDDLYAYLSSRGSPNISDNGSSSLDFFEKSQIAQVNVK
jgi:Subtilase family